MSRSARRKKKKQGLVEQCQKVRQQLHVCIEGHRDEIEAAHRIVEDSSESLVESLQNRIDELEELESQWEGKAESLQIKTDKLEVLQGQVEQQRELAEQCSNDLTEKQLQIADELAASTNEIGQAIARLNDQQERLAKQQEAYATEKANVEQRDAESLAEVAQQLAEANECIVQLQSKLDAANSDSVSDAGDDAQSEQIRKINEELRELKDELDFANEELTKRDEELDFAREEISAAQEKAEHVQDNDGEAETLRTELNSVNEELNRIRIELEEARAGHESSKSELGVETESLQEELFQAKQDLEDLRHQNEDLATQVASAQVQARSSGQPVESMSWEERKEYMLRQLDAEEDGETLTEPEQQQRLEMQEVVASTERELARKDEELDELRRLLEEQSGAMGDVAVGGAAILQMLDQDELILQEREKLQNIQTEWEEKLRQAEIDVSLERAKLARERMEMEQQLADVRSNIQQSSEPETKGTRWLARLGIKDDE